MLKYNEGIQMKKFFKYFTYSLITIICLIVIIALSMIGEGIYHYKNDKQNQIDKIAELEELYASSEYASVSEMSFADFQVADYPNIKLNEYQYLTTHNSYKPDMLFTFKYFFRFSGIRNAFDYPRRGLEYKHNTLTDQLEMGIRGFEIDLNNTVIDGVNTFESYHINVVDMRSNCINLELTLKELKLYSENNPDHLPITIVMQQKNEAAIMPNVEKFDLTAMQALDEIVAENLGEQLITPRDILSISEESDYSSLRTNDNWPTLDELKGKIIVLAYQGTATYEWLDTDTTLLSFSMFPMLKYADLETYDCGTFLSVHKGSDLEIADYVSQNYIIRTEIDSYQDIDEFRKENAISSGAQLLYGDYPPKINGTDEYISYLDDDNHTVIRNDS